MDVTYWNWMVYKNNSMAGLFNDRFQENGCEAINYSYWYNWNYSQNSTGPITSSLSVNQEQLLFIERPWLIKMKNLVWQTVLQAILYIKYPFFLSLFRYYCDLQFLIFPQIFPWQPQFFWVIQVFHVLCYC